MATHLRHSRAGGNPEHPEINGLDSRLRGNDGLGKFWAPDIWTKVGIFAAANSAAEIGLGSMVHTLHLPMGGHIMANLQGMMLTSFLNRRADHAPYTFGVSAISAALKSFSPSGKKFRPMLAILSQGFLFHSAVNVFGAGLAGVAAGQMLIGIWCSVQPFFLQYLFFGRDLYQSYAALFQALESRLSWSLPSPLALLTGWLAFNGALSAMIGLFSYYGLLRISGNPQRAATFYPPAGPTAAASWKQSVLEALNELRRPYFVLPLTFVLGFGYLGKSRFPDLCYLVLRAALIAFLLGLLIRRLDFPGIIRWMQRQGWGGPALALETALAELPGHFKKWKPQKQ